MVRTSFSSLSLSFVFFFFFLSTEKLPMLIKEKPGLPMTPTGNCERILALVK